MGMRFEEHATGGRRWRRRVRTTSAERPRGLRGAGLRQVAGAALHACPFPRSRPLSRVLASHRWSRVNPSPSPQVLVSQFRPPLEKVCLELPAGIVDGAEKAEDAAVRELHEETGFR